MAEPFFPAYAAGEARARQFLTPDFRDPALRRQRTVESAGREVHPALLAALARQQDEFVPSDARAFYLDALASGAAAVVTGQQLGLFLGPLYTFHKAASAIAVARALTAESGQPVVPIFWLQSEDHDFAEIDHTHVYVPNGPPLRLTIAPDPSLPARASVGHHCLGPDIAAAHAALAQALGDQPHADEVTALLAAHYAEGRMLSRAFAGVLAAIFAEEGLLVFDPRDAEIAGLGHVLHERAIRQTEDIEHRLVERAAALEKAGFAVQIPPRPGLSLSFFHQGSAQGPRHRLAPRGPACELSGVDARLAYGELFGALATDPLRFSTSALLRPILQDMLLPTAAYVGGPGEINYFAQLPPLYDYFGMRLPLVVPRARFRLVDEATVKLLGKLGMSPAEAEGADAQRLTVQPPSGLPTPEALEADLYGRFGERLDALVAHLPELDPTLLGPAQKTRAAVEQAVGRFLDKYRRALVDKDRVGQERLARVQALLAPGGVPQERFFGFAPFAARLGIRALVERVLAAVDPFAASVRDLEL